MPGKVIHVSDAAHRAVTGFCKREEIKNVAAWASAVLIEAVNNGVLGKRPPVQTRKAESLAERKETSSDGPKPWELPPFWKKSGGEEKVSRARSSGVSGGVGERETPGTVSERGRSTDEDSSS